MDGREAYQADLGRILVAAQLVRIVPNKLKAISRIVTYTKLDVFAGTHGEPVSPLLLSIAEKETVYKRQTW